MTCSLCQQPGDIRAVWLDENRTALVCTDCVTLCKCGRVMLVRSTSCAACMRAAVKVPRAKPVQVAMFADMAPTVKP